MRVKKYVVDSMSDALQQIRTDLGKDAIILNTKPIKTGGFLGMFRKKQIEVIAAIDPAADNQKERTKTAVQRPVSPPLPSSAAAVADKSREKEAQSFAAVLQSAAQQKEPAEAKPQPEWPARKQEEAHTVSKELEEMRGMLWKLVMADESSTTLPEPFVPLRRRLQVQEVDEMLIGKIFERAIKALPAEALQNETDVKRTVKQVLIDLMNDAAKEHGPLQDRTALVNFIGPTGVGKTTTLAKLAAEYTLSKQKKVGMVTSDTYRIAAVEQLKTYANILNVPLKVVYSAEELLPTVERLSDCDMIFMDTAGRNYRNQEYVTEITKLLHSPLPNETILVLSATAKQGDLEAVIQSFAGVEIDRVIFTKIDETSTYGSLFNMIVKHRLSLSYITTGQNVPDDIEVAAPDKIAALILGEINNE